MSTARSQYHFPIAGPQNGEREHWHFVKEIIADSLLAGGTNLFVCVSVFFSLPVGTTTKGAILMSTNTGRHSSMAALERRKAILSVLAERRKETCQRLAGEFSVSVRTIYRDIEELALNHPIETIQGNGGCVRLMDAYYPDTIKMTPKQTSLLKGLMAQMSGDDLSVMQGIIRQFGAR